MSNVLDVSNHQRGIRLSAIPDLDGVIVKATQGSDYVSPSFYDQIEQTLSLGRLAGVYHYVGGQGVEAEAENFTRTIRPHLGRVLVALDWEKEQNAAWRDEAYLKALTEAVFERTHVSTITVYSSRGFYPWALVRRSGCVTWMARYADEKPAYGWQATPWAEGDPACDIRQYTGHGRLEGWGADLDLNKCYITAEQWMAYAAVGEALPVPTPEPADTSVANIPLLTLVANTMQDAYGADDARKAALGSRYQEVQDAINHIDRAPVEELVAEVWAGKWGNDPIRSIALGKRAQEVKDVINASRIYTVVKGDTLSGIGQRLGIRWQTIASKNGIVEPYVIYPGQRLTY